ncbi:hypothetical protein [Halobacterium yunchengense]|uniref:hypothetical protein n=1 Tax=Halobacterium yunchengense TaxID=3108497 RepID=UPI00300AD456
MVRATRNRDVGETGGSTVRSAAQFYDRYVSGWVPTAVRFAVLYAAWIGLTYYVGTTTPSEDVSQLAAVGYWFGWMFAVATLVGIVLVAASEVADRFRLNRRKANH